MGAGWEPTRVSELALDGTVSAYHLGKHGFVMHILFLTDNFPPEVNAPASRTFEHCREWVRAGHRVTVITGAPNFPTGKVFAGYRNRPWQRESMDGIEVVRVWTYIAANSGFAKRTLDYLSFMVTGFLAGLVQRRPDVIVGTSPQFFTNCAAWMLSVFRWRPFVFELRDLWPESIKTVGAMEDSAALRLMEHLELFLYRRAAVVVAVTESFRRNLISRGIDGEKIQVVTNGVDLTRFRPMERDPELAERLGLTGKLVAGYIGTHGMAHALETVLEAARRMAALPEGRDVRFVLLGDGAQKQALKATAEQMGLANVVFLDSVCAFHAIRPPVPPTSGRRFHRHSATRSTAIRPGQSERSDAGVSLLLGGYARRQRPGVAFAHRLAFEGDPVGVVDQSVEDRIGEGGIPDQVVPMLEGQLAGDERGALAVAVVEQLEQIAPSLGVQPHEPPVVDQQQIGVGEAAHELGEAAVGVGEAQFLEQARGAQIARGETLSARLLCQGARQPRLPDAGRAEDQAIETLADPLAGGQLGDQGAIQTAWGGVIDVFQAGAVLEFGLAQTGLQAAILARGQLPVHEQAEALLEAQGVDLGQVELFAQGGGHAGEAQLLELVQGGMMQHRV
ncbi:hypothetical protein ThimaDRAFT_0422 [Thiocapsa marina 5811]|uniref:Glycosyltransferase subfamily 4-like N-terminal domain-containing protein n=1 Tax=Thiocapsa marina 5811 TaxID=768671 RepID=F9U671_9GAMM|nr:hypothetical protein ThimaDRAFT_0422 [Thiocapsa marina 5811]